MTTKSTTSLPGEESEFQVNWSGCKPEHNPIILDAQKQFPGWNWDDEEPLPGEFQKMTAAETTAEWRRHNHQKTAAQSARRYARIKASGPDLTKGEKEALLQAAGNRCQKCGRHQNELNQPLELDHIKPLVLGGSNATFNRQVMCHLHNQQKAGREIDYRGSRKAE